LSITKFKKRRNRVDVIIKFKHKKIRLYIDNNGIVYEKGG